MHIRLPPLTFPLALILFRILLGPLLLLLALQNPNAGPWLIAGIIAATVSDLLDGIIARRLGVATAWFRRLDSIADLAFWLCALVAMWALRSALCRQNAWFILILLALEAATYALSFIRFRHSPATHAYSAKLWSLVLLACFTAILAFNESRFSFSIVFWTYLACWLDVMAILLLLPAWQSDIPSFYHALLIRRGQTIRRHPWFHSATSTL